MSCQSFTDVDSHLLCLPLPKGIGRYQISLSLTLHSGGSHEEQAHEVPSQTAPAAQAAASAAQESEPWQEVTRSRRKLVSQQAATKPSVRKAPTQGSDAPDEHSLAPPQGPLRVLPAAAQQTAPAPISLQKAARPPNSQPMHAAAEPLPYTLPWLADSALQPPSQHQGPEPLPSLQREPLRVTTDHMPRHETHLASHHRPHPGIPSGTSSHEQVCLLAWINLLYAFRLELGSQLQSPISTCSHSCCVFWRDVEEEGGDSRRREGAVM